MTVRAMARLLSAGMCIAFFFIASLPAMGATEQSYGDIYKNSAPQTAQERADLFGAMRNAEEKSVPQAPPYGANLYKALQNPYVFNDPQAALETANTYRELQKYNAVYSSSRSDDNWDYWIHMWLNGPEDEATVRRLFNGSGTAPDNAGVYGILSNPYTFRDPQAGLELGNTYKELQKYNAVYSSSRNYDNWDYWTRMWLNGPET